MSGSRMARILVQFPLERNNLFCLICLLLFNGVSLASKELSIAADVEALTVNETGLLESYQLMWMLGL